MNPYESDVRILKGIGDAKAKLLLRLGISSVGDLLEHYPVRFEDRRTVTPIFSCEDGASVCVTARVVTPVSENYVRKGMCYYKFAVCDDSGTMSCTFFNNKYIKDIIKVGMTYTFFGKISRRGRSVTMLPSEFEPAASSSCTKAIIPVYPLTAGINQRFLRNAILSALSLCADYLDESLPSEITQRYNLCSRMYALRCIHFPEDEKSLEIARRRLVFEEFFLLQTSLRRVKENTAKSVGTRFSDCSVEPFLEKLPFSLTDAQQHVLCDIMNDVSGGFCMNRLVQGDVGSGKTVIAAAAMYLAAKNGCQAAMMAPTEVLALQHFNGLSPILTGLGFKTALLTGSTKKKEKDEIYEKLQSGEISIIFGTHALITEKVHFHRLALTVTDEQHRFGVRQRALLSEKSSAAHTLVMTATPIPRTLALIMYGDMDISFIDSLPPGRQKIDTFCIDRGKLERMYGFIRRETAAGNRAYIVCPSVEESADIPMAAVTSLFKELNEKVFPDIPMGLVHGKMKPAEKEKAMRDFSDGTTKILVATTVIEVGVNVPEATVMAVLDAERFGLSQLHQLRGRVGRGKTKSYCILVCNSDSDTVMQRMKIMTESRDGFKISETDLALRGPGDFFGTRQHGILNLKIASLANDMEVLKESGTAAEELLRSDPGLSHENHIRLRKRTDSLISRLNL